MRDTRQLGHGRVALFRLPLHVLTATICLCLAALIAALSMTTHNAECEIELALELLLRLHALTRAVEFLAIHSQSPAQLLGGCV